MVPQRGLELTILLWFLSPLGRYVGMALLVSAFLAGIYVKGEHDAKVRIQENIIRETTKAVDKARVARKSATDRFDAGRMRDDGFARD